MCKIAPVSTAKTGQSKSFEIPAEAQNQNASGFFTGD